MTDKEQKAAAKKFVEYWQGKGYEKGESQPFWLSLLRDVYGVSEPEKFISFEEQVHLDHTSFIDGYIRDTKVMVEQKGLGKSLRKAIRQSDGTLLSPFQQAKRYITELPVSLHPRWVVTCNFEEFLVYDMEKPNCEPEQIFLKDLPKEYYRLNFLTDTGDEDIKREMEVSLQAGEVVGKLYNAILKQYKNPENPDSLKSLNKLCVRLVFCLYAESAGIFGRHNMFHDYLKEFDVKNVRKALIELFEMLDKKPCDRDPYDETPVSEFPYVNGGLFADENIEIPNFNEEIVGLLLEQASRDFDWSEISPTIFGAVFESTLNPETRRSEGMHYTSIENIHKVIDPLFLDDLKRELGEIKEYKQAKTRNSKLAEFQNKLASLKFLDPACGSGNFLTETYISLRRLENEAIKMRQEGGQIEFDMGEIIKVSIGQFYGIEINDFAVSVARTALWIAESQMMHETEEIVHTSLDFLPLKSYANIREKNALRIDWGDVVSNNEVDFIMGNPPFVGARIMDSPQKADVMNIFDGVKNNGNLDYVSCWYKKAADFMKGTEIRSALVSTNSVTQGEQVAILWKSLFENGVHIDFAYRTFQWDSEASLKAHVHCVIVGFSIAENEKEKIIFENGNAKVVKNINGYLIDAENIFLKNSQYAICESFYVPPIDIGNMPIDNGNYLFSEEEMREFIKIEPKSEKYFRRWYGAYEFINQKPRYCLLLVDCTPNELRSMPKCLERVEKVKEFRLSSNRESTKKLAEVPHRFGTHCIPAGNYLVIPRVSSERRRYIPIGYMNYKDLSGDSLFVVSDPYLYHFGILTSNVHMAWVRTFCGRLKSDYRYSKDIVYNNFPWCDTTLEQQVKIDKTAQAILDARALYPDCSLADLYDELTMPKELRKAHQNNDRAVMQAYGFSLKMTESECVGELMRMYKELTGGNENE